MTNDEPTPPPPPAYPGISAAINAAFPKIPFVASETKTDVDINVAAEHLLELVTGLKTNPDLDFDYLGNMAGIDYEAEGMAVKYHLYSFTKRHKLQITVSTGTGHPHLPSLTGLYAAADWHERETAEMYGFVFDGHPEPKNLLLDEDLSIHPLLKAHPLQKVEILQGIESGKTGFNF